MGAGTVLSLKTRGSPLPFPRTLRVPWGSHTCGSIPPGTLGSHMTLEPLTVP